MRITKDYLHPPSPHIHLFVRSQCVYIWSQTFRLAKTKIRVFCCLKLYDLNTYLDTSRSKILNVGKSGFICTHWLLTKRWKWGGRGMKIILSNSHCEKSCNTSVLERFFYSLYSLSILYFQWMFSSGLNPTRVWWNLDYCDFDNPIKTVCGRDGRKNNHDRYHCWCRAVVAW